ncbi:phosphotransferase [Omnitrophica bacterium]|nr:phosphotransferase [Candidatus Omnitrophota bacterium]
MVEQTENNIINIIKERVPLYYPDLFSSPVSIKKNKFQKRCHTSIIYQYDLHNCKDILKSLIVKKRIYNPAYNNDIKRDTMLEFEVLSHLNKLADGKFSIPRALDALPAEGVLITEKVEGRSLHSYIQGASVLPMTKAKREFFNKTFYKTGEWLREFHSAVANGKKERINTDECINKARLIIDKFYTLGFPQKLGRTVLKTMNTLKKEVSSFEFPLAIKHGDFQPMNIFYSDNKISAMDFGFSKYDITIKDVCNFIVSIDIFFLKYPSLFWKDKYTKSFTDEFLNGYYKDGYIQLGTLKFLKCLGTPESLDKVYERNKNSIIRKKIISFYKDKIQVTINEDRSMV